jgi:hypothetical protein
VTEKERKKGPLCKAPTSSRRPSLYPFVLKNGYLGHNTFFFKKKYPLWTVIVEIFTLWYVLRVSLTNRPTPTCRRLRIHAALSLLFLCDRPAAFSLSAWWSSSFVCQRLSQHYSHAFSTASFCVLPYRAAIFLWISMYLCPPLRGHCLRTSPSD